MKLIAKSLPRSFNAAPELAKLLRSQIKHPYHASMTGLQGRRGVCLDFKAMATPARPFTVWGSHTAPVVQQGMLCAKGRVPAEPTAARLSRRRQRRGRTQRGLGPGCQVEAISCRGLHCRPAPLAHPASPRLSGMPAARMPHPLHSMHMFAQRNHACAGCSAGSPAPLARPASAECIWRTLAQFPHTLHSTWGPC